MLIKTKPPGIALGMATGVAFGIALEKAKVYLPIIIRDQMLFQNFTMLKMFLTATTVGTLSITAVEFLGLGKSSPNCPTHVGLNALGKYGANILGGILLGTGMAISGSCPGTVLAQIGAGVEHSWIALMGAFTGALVYGYVYKFFQRNPNYGKTSPAITVDQYFKISPVLSGVIFAGILSLVVYGFETLRSWPIDFVPVLPGVTFDTSPFTGWNLHSSAWSPIESGVVIGLLQVPSLIFMGATLGASTSYCTLGGLLATCVDYRVDKNAPYLTQLLSKVRNHWQVGLAGGIVLGSFLSASLSSSPPVLTTTIGPLGRFLGGFLIVFGARMAGGCTSGHGISGMAQQSFASFVTVASMFAGGIACALLIA